MRLAGFVSIDDSGLSFLLMICCVKGENTSALFISIRSGFFNGLGIGACSKSMYLWSIVSRGLDG